MAEDLRQRGAGQLVRLDRGHDRTGDELVQISAADAAQQRLDQCLVRLELAFRRGDGLDPDVTLGMETYSLHLDNSYWTV